jgi:hypothetical protein
VLSAQQSLRLATLEQQVKDKDELLQRGNDLLASTGEQRVRRLPALSSRS